MKQSVCKLVLAIFLVAVFCIPAHADPYAPKSEVPAGIEAEKYLRHKIGEITVPQAEEVGIPAYPGAVVVGMSKIDKKRTHPVLTLISSDERSTVSDFYKKHLADWKYEAKKIEEYFWTGEKYFSPARASNQNHPSLILSDLDKNSFLSSEEIGLMPSAKTRIRITYSPVK